MSWVGCPKGCALLARSGRGRAALVSYPLKWELFTRLTPFATLQSQAGSSNCAGGRWPPSKNLYSSEKVGLEIIIRIQNEILVTGFFPCGSFEKRSQLSPSRAVICFPVRIQGTGTGINFFPQWCLVGTGNRNREHLRAWSPCEAARG